MANKATADVMKRMLTEAQKKFGADSCYVAPDHTQTHYGIPIDNLALQYLLCSTVIPLERIIELSGPYGSGKSSLGYDLLRMLVANGGLGSIVETENKSSGALMQSILGEENAECVRMHRAKSMDDGQNRITHELLTYQKAVPGKDIPMGLLLDSLVGNKAEETVEKINKEGHADRTFSKEALIISSFFGALSDKLISYPIVFIYTNHEKDKISDGPIYGSKIRNPGGAAPDFHNTYHIRVTKTGSFKSKLNPGFSMRLVTKKNSMGTDKRSIEIDMSWRYEETDGGMKQITIIDWDKATAELLASDEVPKSLINDIVQVTKITNSKFNCTTLKLKEVTPTEVGKAINADENIMKQLRVALGIFTWKPFGQEPKK